MSTPPVPAVFDLSALKPLIESASGLLTKLLGEPFEMAGGIATDQLAAWRWRNRVRIFSWANEKIKNDRITARVVPPSFLLPLLEASGDVEDPELQAMWANLIANVTADDTNRHPAFIDILRQITPDEARVLSTISEQGQVPVLWVMSEPDTETPIRFISTVASEAKCSRPEMLPVVVNNLDRLGLINSQIGVSGNREMTPYGRLRALADVERAGGQMNLHPGDLVLTDFGRLFLRACNSKPTPQPA